MRSITRAANPHSAHYKTPGRALSKFVWSPTSIKERRLCGPANFREPPEKACFNRIDPKRSFAIEASSRCLPGNDYCSQLKRLAVCKPLRAVSQIVRKIIANGRTPADFGRPRPSHLVCVPTGNPDDRDPGYLATGRRLPASAKPRRQGQCQGPRFGIRDHHIGSG
jgi:hypothetical protein